MKNSLKQDNVQKTLSSLFRENASGTMFRAKYGNFLSLVEFMISLEKSRKTLITGEEREFRHCISQIGHMIENVEILFNYESDLFVKDKYYNCINFMKSFLEKMQEDPLEVRCIEFYEMLMENWDTFKNDSVTYRALADFSAMSEHDGSREEKNELLQLMKELSVEWDD